MNEEIKEKWTTSESISDIPESLQEHMDNIHTFEVLTNHISPSIDFNKAFAKKNEKIVKSSYFDLENISENNREKVAEQDSRLNHSKNTAPSFKVSQFHLSGDFFNRHEFFSNKKLERRQNIH